MNLLGSIAGVLAVLFGRRPVIYRIGDQRWMGDLDPADRTPAPDVEPQLWHGDYA